jgi:hypothetical protein
MKTRNLRMRQHRKYYRKTIRPNSGDKIAWMLYSHERLIEREERRRLRRGGKPRPYESAL